MNKLEELVFSEKYRPQLFTDLISTHKESILKHLENKRSMPSFIFYSRSPGTGKTTLAKLIAKYLDCDILMLNSSEERGIDTIRDKVKLFAQSLSSDVNTKRLVFLDEADSITRIAQDSLRNLMETYSNNAFFIFTANDISKITEAIRSRCVILNFETPDEKQIISRLKAICDLESIVYINSDLFGLLDLYYPDIRGMILTLQRAKIENKALSAYLSEFSKLFDIILRGHAKEVYEKVFSHSFDILAFNKQLFKHLYDNYDKYGYDKVAKASRYIADTEKSWSLGIALEIVFLANILAIRDLLK